MKLKYRLSSDKVLIFGYFTGIILAGALSLWVPAAWKGPSRLAFIDALFTSTSAVCVTGLASVETALYTGLGQSLVMSLIQLGGLGLITFTTLLIMVPRRKISLVNRGIVKDFSIDEIEQDPKAIMRNILIVTFAVEAAGAISLFIAFASRGVERPLFNAVFHAVSAFCNAGFSTFSSNLEAYAGDPHVSLTVAALIVIGGLGFVVVEDVVKVAFRRKRRLAFYSGTVIRTTGALIIAGWAFFTIAEWGRAYAFLEPWQRPIAGLFQSITPRTAGFDTVPQNALSAYSVLFTMGLMFVGGSSGSTAGGIKTSTFFILLMLAIRGTDETNGTLPVRGRAISNQTIIKATQIAIKALMIILAGIALLCVAEADRLAAGDMKLTEIMFEVISAFGTVGLSLGITMKLSVAGKLVIILMMYVGRVGLVAMALPKSARRMDRYVDFTGADHIVG
jgi:trk system potassium uptake protein TrkH